jgi:hypothetical protein
MNTLTNQRRTSGNLLSKLSRDEGGEMTLRFDDANPLQENFAEKLTSAQQELEEVRRRAEELERKKSEYEELSRKRERFLSGKADLVEKFNRAFARLDRETYEAQVRIDELQQVKDGFSRHLAVLDTLAPEHWSKDDLRAELIRALGCIEDASEEYERAVARLGAAGGSAAGERAGGVRAGAWPVGGWWREFVTWMTRGFAFTLPAMGFVGLLIVVRSLFGL